MEVTDAVRAPAATSGSSSFALDVSNRIIDWPYDFDIPTESN